MDFLSLPAPNRLTTMKPAIPASKRVSRAPTRPERVVPESTDGHAVSPDEPFNEAVSVAVAFADCIDLSVFSNNPILPPVACSLNV